MFCPTRTHFLLFPRIGSHKPLEETNHIEEIPTSALLHLTLLYFTTLYFNSFIWTVCTLSSFRGFAATFDWHIFQYITDYKERLIASHHQSECHVQTLQFELEHQSLASRAQLSSWRSFCQGAAWGSPWYLFIGSSALAWVEKLSKAKR